MPKPLSNREISFLRDIRNGVIAGGPSGDPRLGSWGAKTAELFRRNGLITRGSFELTDKGLDALETHFILDPDEKRPRWELVFEKYIVEFKVDGLLKLRKDLLHDLNLEGEPRIGSGSFEMCPLSYRDGKRGSFDPDVHLVEHTENAFVTYWDEINNRSADSVESSSTKWQNEDRAMKKMVELLEKELVRRKVRLEE
jgi:hypothetical protein